MRTLKCSALVAAAAINAGAQMVDISLFRAEESTLPPAAREAYREAVACTDQTDQIGTVHNLAIAAEAAPDVLELQWLLCQTAEAYVRGDNFGLEDALRVADQVVAAYERMIASEALPDWARPTVERYHMRLLSLLDTLDERIEARREAGAAYMQQAAALRQQADLARERYTARMRAERAQNPDSDRVTSGDAVDANPLLLPSAHYDSARISSTASDVVGAASPLLLPSRYYR